MAISVDEARFYIATIRQFMIWNTSGQAHASSLEDIIEKSRTGLSQTAGTGPATAMDMWFELVDSAVKDTTIRRVFAENSMFEFVLTFERQGALDKFVGVPGGYPIAMRLRMLAEIYGARESGVFLSADHTGVVTWIHSVGDGLQAVVNTLLNDHTGNGTRGKLCQIIADLTIPEAWAKGSPSPVPMASPTPSPLLSAIESLRGEIASLDLSVQARGNLANQADRAKSRLIAIAGGAQSASSAGGGGGGFRFSELTLPDGTKVKVANGRPVPWYERPRYWLLGIGGMVAGVMLANYREQRPYRR